MTIYLAFPPAARLTEIRFWRSDVTAAVEQPTRGRAGRPCPPIWPCSRWGLAAAASPQTAGRSYRPISPLSFHCWKDGMFLCHFPSPATVLPQPGPGRYPAPCPVEPGLSSPPILPRKDGAAATQSTRPLAKNSSTLVWGGQVGEGLAVK